ncbi:MAG: type I pantothenate kinase [Microthrixaceae bacterium]
MNPADHDPALVALADELLARRGGGGGGGDGRRERGVDVGRDRAEGAPLTVGIVGSVAVGKSTFADALARQLVARAATTPPLTVEVIVTDAFLLSNDRMAPLGGAMGKGYPESYDWDALASFLADAVTGAPVLSTPIYSHETFDVVPGERHEFARPDVLIVEGLNLLQTAPADVDGVDAGWSPADHLAHTIYVHAPATHIEQWFVDRFVALARPADGEPSDFYAMFAGMADDELDAVARWTWSEINAPNLRDHIAPTRDRAHVVVHKGADHRIVDVERRTS